MKSVLFSPSTWRKKKSFAEQQRDSLPSTPTRTSLSSSVQQPPALSLIDIGSAVKRSTSFSKTAPRRPPRPPSLNLPALPNPVPTKNESVAPEMNSEQSPPVKRRPNPNSNSIGTKRSMPELDGVWKGFLQDIDEDPSSLHKGPLPELPSLHRPSTSLHSLSSAEPNSSISPRRNGKGPSKSRPPPLLRSSKSTSNVANYELSSSSPRSSISSGDSLPYATDFDSLALFPAPPPLIIRRKIPKALVLQPTPSLAPLPPSPNLSSPDSTPLATPTTPTPQYFRRPTNPQSILKKSASSAFLYACSAVTSDTPVSEPAYHRSPYPPNGSLSRPGRIAHSVSNPTPSGTPLPLATMAHRPSSSETTALSSRRNVTLRLNKPLPPVDNLSHGHLSQLGRRRLQNNSSPEVEWGIAV